MSRTEYILYTFATHIEGQCAGAVNALIPIDPDQGIPALIKRGFKTDNDKLEIIRSAGADVVCYLGYVDII
jgi:hypothetical protein